MKSETKVGLLFLTVILSIAAFAYLLGGLNPFSDSHDLDVAYNFAGGIEVGSPVRVMGIKVGKVREIKFEPDLKMPSGEEVKLRISISIDRKAWNTIREDSRFFINLAGVIGEKFIEITPGSIESAKLEPGSLRRGEDPPRIDQLISQSYGLAGKMLEFVQTNEGSVIETINMMNKLVLNLNQTLKMLNQTTKDQNVAKLLRNMTAISEDVAVFTHTMRTEDGKKTLQLIEKLIWRLDGMDAKAIKKFFQEDGIKAKLF